MFVNDYLGLYFPSIGKGMEPHPGTLAQEERWLPPAASQERWEQCRVQGKILKFACQNVLTFD